MCIELISYLSYVTFGSSFGGRRIAFAHKGQIITLESSTLGEEQLWEEQDLCSPQKT